MKKRSTAILVALAVMAVLSLGLASSALAMWSPEPVFSYVSPSTASNGPGSSFQLAIHGSNFSEISSIEAVRLEMVGPPYDVIYATNEQLNFLMPPSITCNINTWGETPGTYNVAIDWWNDLIGELWPETSYIYGAFTVTAPTPTPSVPFISSVTPTKATAGGPAFMLTVNGSNFSTGSMPAVVKWNGQALMTTPGGLPNPTAWCTAVVPANLIATPGIALITVSNPNIGGGVSSNTMNFAITTAPPVLTGIAPATTWAKFVTPPLVVLSGSGFTNGATVRTSSGVSRAATYVSPNQLNVQLTAADVALAGTVTVSVTNPDPGGGTSAALPFSVIAETSIPVTTMTGADALWHNTPVNLTVTATDSQSGVQMTQWGVGTVPPWTTLVGSIATVPAPAGGSGDGVKTVSAFSTDNCGNVGATVTATVNICTNGPATEAFSPGTVTKGKTLKLGYQADSITPTCTITFKMFKSNGSIAKTINLGEKPSNTQGSYKFTCNMSRGKYKVKVYSTDAAGNAQSTMTGDSFTVS